MHILFCIPSLAMGKGGAERVAAELGVAMTERGHIVSFAYKFNPLSSTNLPQYSVPEDSCLLTWDNTLAGIQSFRKKVRALNPDLIQIFYEQWVVIEVYNLVYDLEIPICFQECSNPQRVMDENWGGASIAAQMRADILKNSVGIRVTQNEYKKSFPAQLQDLVYAFPNAFKLSSNNAINPFTPKNILHIGGAKPHKQAEVVLEAFEKIYNKFPNWNLILCTSAPVSRATKSLYEKLKEKIRTQFMPGRVLLVENNDDMDAVYKKSAIHCIASLSEGLPNCVCESMCHGIPSVGYADSIGTNFLIEHEVNGILAPTASRVDSLAAALTRLMENDELRRKLGTNAWAQAAKFNPDVVYDAWEIFFTESLARNSVNKKRRSSQVNIIKDMCTDYDSISESSWKEYINRKIQSLHAKNVIFFGCGELYNEFKNMFTSVIPVCILVDKCTGNMRSVDGIDIVPLNDFTDDLHQYPVVIFSRFARLIEYRLRREYNLKYDIICIDTRMYEYRNTNFNFTLSKNDILKRKQRIDAQNQTYYRHENNTLSVNNEFPSCAFCGESKSIPYLSTKNVDWYGGDTFQIVRCSNCNLVYASPRPTESYVIKYFEGYGQEFFHRKLNRPNVQTDHDEIAKKLLLLAPNAKKAFDIGFGAGTMLHAYKKLGLVASGNEVNSYACNKLSEQGFDVYNMPTLKLPTENKYDIITALDYFEHSFTPFDDLLKINDMLNDGGIMYMKTLYLESPDHIIKGEKWQLFGKEHFYYYFKDIIKTMIENAGFVIIELKLKKLIYITAKKVHI